MRKKVKKLNFRLREKCIVRKYLELNMLFSPVVGILQSYGIYKLVIHLFFQSVFRGRSLLCWFSGSFAWVEFHHLLSGSLCCFCSLLVFRASSESQSKNGYARISGPELQNCSLPSLIRPPRSNHLHFCVHQTHRLPQFTLTAVLPGRVPGAHKNQWALCLCDCKWLWAGVPTLLPPPKSHLGGSHCPFQGYYQPESCCPVLGTAVLSLPGVVKWPTGSSPLQSAQAKSGLHSGPACGLWWQELRVPSGLLTLTSLFTPLLGPSVESDMLILSMFPGILRPPWST